MAGTICNQGSKKNLWQIYKKKQGSAMTKTKQSLVNDPAQLSLFDTIKRDQDERTAQRPGRMCVTAKLQAAVKTAVKSVPKSREQIADCMTELAGCEVTVSMLNNYLAESHPHKLPADLIAVLCEATGDYGPLLVLNDSAGIFTVEPPDVIRARLQKLDEKKKELDKEKQKYAALLHELERKP
jgi:hypothetical protein